MSNSIVVDEQTQEKPAQSDKTGLAGYVMGYVDPWRRVRDSEYQASWDRGYQTFRGIWDPSTKNKDRERSKLIPPGFAMAVELTVAEIIEGVFSRWAFFDVNAETVQDPQQRAAAKVIRDRLLNDLYKDGIIATLTEAVMCGALYGNGILKIHTGVRTVKRPKRVPKVGPDGKVVNGPNGQPIMVVEKETLKVAEVRPVSVEPGQFVPDPGTPDLEEMLGFAFEYPLPLHLIRQRQADGQYLEGTVTAMHSSQGESAIQIRRNPSLDTSMVETAWITEWHGFVPRSLLAMTVAKDDTAFLLAANPEDDELVDSVVMIANGSTVLKAQPNPSVMEDRAAVSWQHGTIPGRFHGRSVWEMAKHVHLAQEAEMRARVDNLAWTANPMLKADLTKLPPKTNFNAWPGKVWATRGNPDEAIKEMRFADINQSTFQHMGELQQMMQQATGTVDSLASARSNIRDETATGSALAASGFLKRAKRVMYNIETALTAMVTKLLTRKMQFQPDQYPEFHDFVVQGTMGMMAREVEAQQLLQALQFVDKGSPAHLLVLRTYFAGSSSPDRADLLAAVDKMMQPDPQQQQVQQQLQKLQLGEAMLTLQKLQAEIGKLGADAALSGSKKTLTDMQVVTERVQGLIDNARLLLDKQEVDNQAEQNAISREKLDVEREKIRRQPAK